MNSVKFCFCLIYFLLSHIAFTQTPTTLWSKTIGGSKEDEFTTVLIDADGNILLAGGSTSNDFDFLGGKGKADAWVIKMSSSGTIIWKKNFGGSDDDGANCIIQTQDGNYVLVGSSRSADGDLNTSQNRGLSDVWIFKIDKNGTLLWSTTYGGSNVDYAIEAIETKNKALVLGVSSYSADGDFEVNKGQADGWILKLTESGKLIWKQSFGGTKIDIINGISNLDDEHYIAAGYTWSNDNGMIYGGFITKIDDKGSINWIKRPDLPNRCLIDSFFGVFSDTQKNIVSVGDCIYNQPLVDYHRDILVTKTDADGKTLWTKNFGGLENEFSFFCKAASNGNYIIGGWSRSAICKKDSARHTDFWVIEVNHKNGDLVWQKCIGGNKTDQAIAGAVTKDDEVVVAGYSTSSDYDFKINKGSTDAAVAVIKNEITGLSNPFTNNSVTIFPNPANQVISFEAEEKLSKVQFFDALGRLEYTQLLESNTHSTINCSHLTEGVKFVQIYGHKGQLIKTAKISIAHF